MRILFLASWFPSKVLPTHGNFVAKHARVVGAIHDVCVLNIQDDPGLTVGEMNMEVVQQDSYTLYQIHFGQSETTAAWKRIWLRYRAWKKLVIAYRRDKGIPDCIHAHVLLDAGMLAGLLSKWWKIPFVITEHSTAYWSPNALSNLRLWFARWACRNAFQIMPVTEALGSAMKNNGLEGHYGAVSNVVDTELFAYEPPAKQPPFVLLHISNFKDWHKNVSGLMRAFKQVLERSDREIILHLAGDGDLDVLRSNSAFLALPKDKVQLSGALSEQEVAKVMQQSHAFVLFSNVENQPVVLLEALSSGRPCIATRVGGVPDMINTENGIIVSPKTEIELIEATLHLVNTYNSYNFEAIRSSTVNQCSEAAVAAAFTTIYQAALAANS